MEKSADRRLFELTRLWAWRLRLGRNNLSEAERDIHVVVSYADGIEAADKYTWDAPELVGHPWFFSNNILDIERLIRMLRELDLTSIEEPLREALGYFPLPSPPPTTPRDARLAIEAIFEGFGRRRRRRLRELDLLALSRLPETEELASALLEHACRHEDEILVPERSQPEPPAAVEPAPKAEPASAPPRLDTKWEDVRDAQPDDPPPYGPSASFTPGSWLRHPKLGKGFIVDVREGKLRVLFETGERKLAVPA